MVDSVLKPENLEQLQSIILGGEAFTIQGHGSMVDWYPETRSKGRQVISMTHFDRLLEVDPANQTVTVQPGLAIQSLQIELAKVGYCLPIGGQTPVVSRSLGGAIAMNLPHTLMSQCGSFRDWVLGLQIVCANGSVARSGSKVVKSVAGYDVHKLLVGSHGELGIITEVTLKIFPLKALPTERISGGKPEGTRFILRDQNQNFAETYSLFDQASGVVWTSQADQFPKTRICEIKGKLRSQMNLTSSELKFCTRLKDLLDPTGKFPKLEVVDGS